MAVAAITTFSGNGRITTTLGPASIVRINSLAKGTGTSMMLNGVGVPGATHTVEATGDLSQPFAPIGSATANSNGNFQFEDVAAPNFTKRFYRVVLSPTDSPQPADEPIVFSVTIIDSGGAYSSYYPAITAAVEAAGAEWSRYLVGSTNLEVEVTITSSVAVGGYSATSGFVRNDGTRDIFEQGAAYELRTGIDPNGANPDILITVPPFFLADVLWFDPQPAQRTDPVPPDRVDAISVFTRWLGGAFVFNGWMNPTTGELPPTYMSTFDANIQFDGSNFFFVGPTAVTRYGGPVPLTYGNIYRLGNNPPRPGSNLLSDLMNGPV